VNKVLATGDTVRVFNGYCGAESGYVPVATVAPAALVAEIELQRWCPRTSGAPSCPRLDRGAAAGEADGGAAAAPP